MEKDSTQEIMSDTLDRGVCDKLDIEDVDPITVNVPKIEHDKVHPINDTIKDYEYIRTQSIKNIATCDAILDHALRTMNFDANARHIESCSTLIDTSMKCSKSLIEIHEKLKKMRAIENPNESGGSDDPVKTFVGSVKDVIKHVQSEMDNE